MEQDYNNKKWNRSCPNADCRKSTSDCGIKYVYIPSTLGDDQEGSSVAPRNGDYSNAIVYYEANGAVYIYSSEGVPVETNISDAELKGEIRQLAETKADKSELPTKLSQLLNDAGYITNTVDNLANYYTKSQTYTKTEVNNLIGHTTGVHFEIVDELPTVGNDSTIYLVPRDTNEEGNVYDEYVYISGEWEKIGSTDVDLDGYATEEYVDTALETKVDKVEGKGLSENDFTDADKTKLAGLYNYDDTTVRNLINNKVDKVTGKGLSTNDYTNEDKTKLAGINMALKQDVLASGVNIKTVNGTSILGSGNISTPTPSTADVTTAVNNWLTAHPEATTTVQDGAVSVMKLGNDTTALITRGANLMGHKSNVFYKLPKPVGPTGMTSMRATMQDGKIFDNTTTGGGTDHECLLRIIFWDENKQYIDYYTCKTGTAVKDMSLGGLARNAYYVTWNIDTSYYGNVMVNYGSESLPYEEYKYEEIINDDEYEYVEIQKNILYDYVADADKKITYDPYLPDVWTPGTIDSSTGQDKTTDLTTQEQYRFFSPTYIDLQDVEEFKLIKLHTDWQMAPFFYTASSGLNHETSTLINHPDNGVYTAYDRTWKKEDFNGARFLRIGGRRQNDAQQTGGHNEQYCKYFQIVLTRKKRTAYESELYYDPETLVQGSMPNKTTSGVLSTDLTAVSTQDIIAFPYCEDLKVKIHIDGGYEVCFGLGNKPTYLVTYGAEWLTKYYGNGDIVDIPDGAAFYRICIKKRKRCASTFDSFYDLAPTEAKKVYLKFEIVSNPLRKLNGDTVDKEELLRVRTSQYHTIFPPQGGQTGEKCSFKNPLIVHVSDVHGDYKRLKNAYDFSKYLKPALFANTGDTVAYDFTSGTTWVKSLIKDYDLPQMMAIGNHDVYPSMDATKTGSARFVPVSDTDVYNNLFGGVESELGITTNHLYYYRDLPEYKLRAIVTCLYEYGGAENSEKVRKYTHLKVTNGTSPQLDWFAATLKSTPADYGAIVLQHSLQDEFAPSEGYTEFFHPLDAREASAPATDGYNHIYESDGTTRGVPFYDIVDAFISKTTIQKTYVEEALNGTETFSINYDFSTGLNNNVEFIAWLSGHIHHDTVHYVTGTQNLQLELNINTTAAIYGAVPGKSYSYPYYTDSNEQARYKNESAEDAFNVYAIDRDYKTIDIVRIGNTLVYDKPSGQISKVFKERTHMKMPYADIS